MNLAIETLREFVENTDNAKVKDAILELHPALAESKDEKIRKKMVEHFKNKTKKTWCNIPVEDIISCLEKQKVQNPKHPSSELEFADKYSKDVWEKLMTNFKTIQGYHIGCNDVSDIVFNAILDAFKWQEQKSAEIAPNQFDVTCGMQGLLAAFPTFSTIDEYPKDPVTSRAYSLMARFEEIIRRGFLSMCGSSTCVNDVIVRETAQECVEVISTEKSEDNPEKSKVPVEPADIYADEIVKWENAHPDWNKDRMRATALHFFKLRLQAAWSEDGKKSFVDSGFLWCVSSFEDFKAGETYWLEYLSNDNYSVRSDNLLARTYHITPEQLYSHFYQYIEQKSYEPHNWPADKDNLTQEPNQEWSKEDEETLACVISVFEDFAECKNVSVPPASAKRYLKRLKSLRPQPNQEWSEEDEKMLTDISWAIRYCAYDDKKKERVINWFTYRFKSLLSRPKPSGNWKPTKDDKRILKGIIGFIDHDQHYGVSNEEMVDWLKKTFSEFA